MSCAGDSLLWGDEATIPADFRQILKGGEFGIWTDCDGITPEKPEKTLLESAAKVRPLFALPKDVLAMAPEGDWRKGLIPDALEVLICKDGPSFEAAGGAPRGGTVCPKLSTIGQPLFHRLVFQAAAPDTAFAPGMLGDLRHELAHIAFTRALPLGEPAWLNEGLAEFLRGAESVQSREGAAAPADILDRLGKRSGPLTPVTTLVAYPAAAMDRDRYDEAWLLVDYLLRTSPGRVSELLASIAWLDRQATDRVCRDDVLDLSAWVFRGLFPDLNALDKALGGYLQDLLKDPKARPKGSVKSGKAARPGFDIQGTFGNPVQTTDVTGRKSRIRTVKGSITNVTPFACAAQAQFGFGDGAGHWGEWLELAQGNVPAGQGLSFDEHITVTEGQSPGKFACVTVAWRGPRGGPFISRRQWAYR